MRARLVFAGVVAAAALVAAAACSIDEGGSENDGSADVKVLEGGADGPNDAPIDVVQGCSTLDATACVDSGLPVGWTWAVVALADQACPPGDYKPPTKYLYGLGLEAGACACGCTPTGPWSCAGQIEAGTMPNCNAQSILFDAGDDAECIDPGWGDPHIGLGPLPAPSGAPSCTPQEGGTGAWSSQAATDCAPGCTVDYCALDAGPFSRCIISPGNNLCPAPFTQPRPTMGTSDKVAVACGACGCSVDPPAPCTATVLASTGDLCTSLIDASDAVGSCPTPGGNGFHINSFLYVPHVPAASCTPDGGAGSVTFTSTVTVCCLP